MFEINRKIGFLTLKTFIFCLPRQFCLAQVLIDLRLHSPVRLFAFHPILPNPLAPPVSFQVDPLRPLTLLVALESFDASNQHFAGVFVPI